MRRTNHWWLTLPAATALDLAAATPGGAESSATPSNVPADTAAETTSNVPDELLAYGTSVDLAYDDVSLVWDDASGTLAVVLAPGVDTAPALDLAAEQGVAAEIEVQTGAYSQAQLKQAAADLVASGEVTWAAPDPTGAGLDVGVD